MESDYYRPSMGQVRNIYECDRCGAEMELESMYDPAPCSCGGRFEQSGESYPADPSEWDEQLDPDGVWRERRW